jgi:hypothetical protein
MSSELTGGGGQKFQTDLHRYRGGRYGRNFFLAEVSGTRLRGEK